MLDLVICFFIRLKTVENTSFIHSFFLCCYIDIFRSSSKIFLVSFHFLLFDSQIFSSLLYFAPNAFTSNNFTYHIKKKSTTKNSLIFLLFDFVKATKFKIGFFRFGFYSLSGFHITIFLLFFLSLSLSRSVCLTLSIFPCYLLWMARFSFTLFLSFVRTFIPITIYWHWLSKNKCHDCTSTHVEERWNGLPHGSATFFIIRIDIYIYIWFDAFKRGATLLPGMLFIQIERSAYCTYTHAQSEKDRDTIKVIDCNENHKSM